MKWYIAVIFCTASLAFSNWVFADIYSERSAQYASAARDTWEQEIKPKFASVMSVREKSILDMIDFRFPAGGGAYDAFATIRHGQRIVLISGAFVAFQDAALDATVVATHFDMQNQILPYLEFAWEEGMKNTARMELHQNPVLVPPFASYTRLDLQKVATYMMSEEYSSRMTLLRIKSLAFVIGHEIGHHISGEFNIVDDSEQMKREIAADLYSVNLLLKVGFSPFAAIPLMLFFHEDGGDSRHPPPLCRAVAFFSEGLPSLLQRREFMAFIREHPDEKAKLDRMKTLVDRNSQLIQDECGGWSIINN